MIYNNKETKTIVNDARKVERKLNRIYKKTILKSQVLEDLFNLKRAIEILVFWVNTRNEKHYLKKMVAVVRFIKAAYSI